MSHMLLIVLIVLILQRFELTCGIVQRSYGLWGTGSALVSRMISLKDTQLWTGRVYCMVKQEYWVIIRSLQSFQTRLLATCTNMMLTHIPHTHCLPYQWTIVIYMCMESSRLRRYCMNRKKQVKKTYDTYNTYYTLLMFCNVVFTYVTYSTYRIGLCWIPWESYAQQKGQAILQSSTPLLSDIQSTQTSSAFLVGRLQEKNWESLIVKTLSSYARQEYLMGPLSYEWITFGSARYFSCFRSNPRQT